MFRWQNSIFNLVIDGITSKLRALKPQGVRKPNTHTHKRDTKKLTLELCQQNTHLGLAFIPEDGVLEFFSEESKETIVLPSEATLKLFFAVKPTKSEPSACHLGDI